MSRLPLRLRLTLVFALAMAVVLTATGVFVYVRVGDSLDRQVDDGLRARADLLAAALESGDVEQALPGGDDEFAQVLGPGGAVLAATPGFEEPLLSGPEQTAAAAGGLRTETSVSPPGENESEPARLLARPVEQGVVVVGASLEDRDEALAGLLVQLLIGGPFALLLASAAGYLLAGAALRPVEAMRRRAAEISADTPGERLPLPAARDELQRLAATLNAMIDRLDAGLQRERRFVADASHELRTPLAVLQTEIDLALRRPRTGPELEDALRSVAEEVDRLTRLADDLLLLATSDEPRLEVRRSRFPVGDLLDGVARRSAARAAAAGTRIELGDLPAIEVEADRLRLEQALGNLVDNALRHGAGPVVLDATTGQGVLTLRVRDRGTGFPPAFVAHAFERFSRADDSRSTGGAGLGLAIVDAIARAHGGTASARNRSDDGRGAEVSISIPL
jgi:two-component system, OmpR family, sensor kinase